MQWTLLRNNYDDVMSDFNPYGAWRLFNEDVQQDSTMVRKSPLCSQKTLSTSCVVDEPDKCHIIISVPTSDHRGCVIQFKLSEIVKGVGFWKFYNSLLGDIVFVN